MLKLSSYNRKLHLFPSEEVSKETLGRSRVSRDDEKENFIMFNVVNKCEYRDGVFTTRFTKEMKPLISIT